MAKKLKNVSVNSVDLCKQGANQRAFICLKKSMEEKEMSELKTSIIQNVCKKLNISMEDICKALNVPMQQEESQEEKMKKSMVSSLTSILQDESKTVEQKQEVLQKSVTEFYSTVYDFAKSESEQPEEEQEVPQTQQPTQATLHPEVKKALQEAETAKEELEKLKKSLELKEFESIAKQYEVIGKNTEELATKLYELKKSNEESYKDYIAMLDEMVSMTEASGIFKEYGSNRAGAGNKKQQAEQRIKELMKSDSALTYEEAFTRVCEESAELKKALEY